VARSITAADQEFGLGTSDPLKIRLARSGQAEGWLI